MNDIGMILIGLGISALAFTLLLSLGHYILVCFDLPGLTRIPNDTWREDIEKSRDRDNPRC